MNPTTFPTTTAATGHLALSIGGRPHAPLAPTASVVIGRDPTSDVLVECPGVSRRHAELRPTAAGWYLVDLGSRNGTFVDGFRVSQPVLLDRPTRVELGDPTSTVVLDLVPLAAAAPAAPFAPAPPMAAWVPAPPRPAVKPRGRALVAAAAALAVLAGAAGLAVAGDHGQKGSGPAATAAPSKGFRAITRIPEAPETAEAGQASPGEGIYQGRANNGTMADFLTAVLQDVDGYWSKVFQQAGLQEPYVNYAFPEPGESVASQCSDTGASNDNTAAYCSADDQIVVSISMAARIWNGELTANKDDHTGRTAGDFSVAYAIAHEYAHSLQSELGLLDDGTGHRRYPVIATELHADCWAGVWANSAYYAGSLDPGDVQEGIDAAALVGDYDYQDTTGHHGTPQQRMEAFTAGYNSGVPRDCDQFLQVTE